MVVVVVVVMVKLVDVSSWRCRWLKTLWLLTVVAVLV